MPALYSSEFSRKMIISVSFRALDREGTPGNTARTNTGVQVKNLRKATLMRADSSANRVVSGPLIATRYSRINVKRFLGNHSPVC